MILTMKKMHLINRQVGTTWYAKFDYQTLHNVFQNIDLIYLPKRCDCGNIVMLYTHCTINRRPGICCLEISAEMKTAEVVGLNFNFKQMFK